ncbi:hypothetical protein J4231_03545 [Candidatus Woesearchaeota archaeon]|nr:hypothetical protein [Candidatus Woesearchaeota archaeon]
MAETKRLEDKLMEMGIINAIAHGINSVQSGPEERQRSYDLLARVLSNGDPKHYKNAYGDIRVSPEEAIRYANDGLETRKTDAEPDYNEGKKRIISHVLSAMNSDVDGSESKAEAASRLYSYFMNLVEPKELDQATADSYAQEDAANALGVGMNFTARGSIEAYKKKHNSVQARLFGANFLKDKKDKKGKVIGCYLDESKVTDFMEDVVNAAVLYTNAENIAAAKKKAKSKKP